MRLIRFDPETIRTFSRLRHRREGVIKTASLPESRRKRLPTGRSFGPAVCDRPEAGSPPLCDICIEKPRIGLDRDAWKEIPSHPTNGVPLRAFVAHAR